MLVLTRSVNERIVIGDDIAITVVAFDRASGQVRLGIEAPREVIVDREEIHEKRKQGRDHGGRAA